MSPDAKATVDGPQSGPRSSLQVLYAGAVVIAALYFGRELVIPLVLAAFLAFVLAPACALLQRVHLPRVLAVLLAVMLAFSIIGGLGSIVGRQAAALVASLPAYQSTVTGKLHALAEGDGLVARAIRSAMPSLTESKDMTAGPADAVKMLNLGESSSLTIARTVAQPLLGPLETGGIVLVFTIFILLSSEDIRDRLVRLVGRHDLHRTIIAMNDAARRLSQYFLFQLALNTGFGLVIGTSLWLVGLPNPILWGILAGMMRFVPFIGVVIALAPPLLLAVAVVPGWTQAIIVLALFGGAELVMGQIVEPLIYGHRTGLSPLAVIVATAFWALLWGPIGLLIATPLTVCLVVIGRHVESLAFLDVILGDQPPLDPHETFYQRALEHHALMLAPAARQQIASSSLTDYFDTVALPGLALAERDLMRDDLAFERLEAIHAQIESLLARLAAERGTAGHADDVASEGGVDRPGPTILCMPGRGQLDDLAATMAVQALTGAGFSARLEANTVLGSPDGADLDGAALCCLSVLEKGSSVSGIRYFIRRIQKRMPEAAIVIGLWHADRDSPLLGALRAEGGDEHLVLSIGELVALARTLTSRRPALSLAGAESLVAHGRPSAPDPTIAVSDRRTAGNPAA